MMVAAARKPAPSKKRKISDDQSQRQQPEPTKKKSPLFNQPQKFYAPTSIASMRKDELSEWRKEQRRVRNRESAAASRNKTRARIEELEGEADKWRHMYRDIEVKMRCMERQIQFLTKLNSSHQDGGQQQHLVFASPPQLSPSPVVSHPNSPPGSPLPSSPPVIPVPITVTSFAPPTPVCSSHIVADPFPALLSEPHDCTLAEKQEAAAVMSNEESSEHITLITRQAVKITGANSDSSLDHIKQQQQVSVLPVCDSLVKDKEGEEVDSIVRSGTPKEASVEGNTFAMNRNETLESVECVPGKDNVFIPEGNDASYLGYDDGDLLDLLVDTLDGEFDPNLFI